MDSNTVAVMLATNLVFSGLLYFIIGRSMPAGSGLGLWSTGSILFGGAYLGRLLGRLLDSSELSVQLSPVFDVSMFAGGCLLWGGLQQFVGHRAISGVAILTMSLAYAGLQSANVPQFGLVGRYALLNAIMSVCWTGLAWTAGKAAWGLRGGGTLRFPLALTSLMFVTLGLLTVVRCGLIVHDGLAAMFDSRFSTLYYGYASVAVYLLSGSLLWMVFARLHGELASMATHDALTKLLNRNGLDEALNRHFGGRGAQPLSLLEVDVDHFKKFNDQYGHAVGDRVLRAVADSLKENVRASDFVARVGGEEFVVGCVTSDTLTALQTADRLRRAIADLSLKVSPRESVKCTVSIGVSPSFHRLSDWEEAMRRADAALYAAKSNGRDRAELWVAVENCRERPNLPDTAALRIEPITRAN